MRIIVRIVSLLLTAVMLFALISCSADTPIVTENTTNSGNHPVKEGITDLMSGISESAVAEKLSEDDAAKLMKFGLNVFSAGMSRKESTLISPLSLAVALGMTADGTSGNTLKQFENLFGMSADDFDSAIYNYVSSLPNGEDSKLISADSIWISNSIENDVSKDYLKRISRYYSPDVYQVTFGEQSTVDFINKWAQNNTGGKIDSIVDELSKDTLAVLMNALLFEAVWEEPIDENMTVSRTFSCYDGTKTEKDFMYSNEHGYFKIKDAQGYVKDYKGGQYKFVAILPAEGKDLLSFINNIDSSELFGALKKTDRKNTVAVNMPKFTYGFDASLVEALQSLGITDAFDSSKADFSAMIPGCGSDVTITDVLHKTHIELSESGTVAAAVTAVIIGKNAVQERLVFDRPFVYMIVDSVNNVPIFIGTVLD